MSAKRETWYSLPESGPYGYKSTKDEREYVAAWQALGRLVESVFPGFRCSGFDPGIQMSALDYSSSFTLSVSQVESLKKGIECLQNQNGRPTGESSS